MLEDVPVYASSGCGWDEIQISADCRGQLNIGCLQTIQVLKSQKKYVTENVAKKQQPLD